MLLGRTNRICYGRLPITPEHDSRQQIGTADMESLGVVDSNLQQGSQSAFVLHTLGDRADSHDPRDALNGLHDRQVERIRPEIAHEGAIDFQQIDGQSL